VIGWLRRSGVWEAAARITPRGLRPLIRGGLMRRPGKISMDPKDRDYLHGYYREDIEKLAGMVGRNLDGWLLMTGAGIGGIVSEGPQVKK
jgi:hypothetical protein